MATPQISTQQFIGWVVLVTLAFGFVVGSQGSLIPFFGLLTSVAGWVIMPPQSRNRPLTSKDLLLALAAVLATAALIWWLATHAHRTAETDARNRSFRETFSSPLVAVPLWLAFLYLGYRRWRGKTPEQRELRQEPDPP